MPHLLSSPWRIRQVLALASLALTGCGTSDKDDDGGEDAKGNFAPDHIVDVALTVDEADWETLRMESRSIPGELSGDCRDAPFSGEYTWFSADVTIDGESQDNIGIRKKGFIGSQSTTKPGLKLNIDKYVEDAELFGVDNIVLNNAVQDSALIRQCLSYWLFERAGLPASQCNFARVSVNGESLGIYAHVEPVKPAFIRSHFSDDEGDLYEATLSDFHPLWYKTFEPKTDETDTALTPIVRLVEALEEDGGSLEDILSAHIDLDQFITFLAMETWVGHWDGYGGNQNNYFVYQDTKTNRLSFIPWGMDGTLDPDALEESFMPNSGHIPIRILESETLSDRYYDRLGELLDTVWNEDEILAEIDRMEALLSDEPGMAYVSEEIEGVRTYVRQRRENVRTAIPVKAGEIEDPFCMEEMGSVTASFETTWDSGWDDLADILSTGDLEMTVTYDGDEIPFSQAGVVANHASSEDGEEVYTDYGSLIMLGEFNAGESTAYVLPYLSFPIEMAAEGASIPIGIRGAEGALLYAGADTEYEFVEAGSLWDGVIILDEFGTTPGSAISGTVSTGIYVWTEITK